MKMGGAVPNPLLVGAAPPSSAGFSKSANLWCTSRTVALRRSRLPDCVAVRLLWITPSTVTTAASRTTPCSTTWPSRRAIVAAMAPPYD